MCRDRQNLNCLHLRLSPQPFNLTDRRKVCLRCGPAAFLAELNQRLAQAFVAHSYRGVERCLNSPVNFAGFSILRWTLQLALTWILRRDLRGHRRRSVLGCERQGFCCRRADSGFEKEVVVGVTGILSRSTSLTRGIQPQVWPLPHQMQATRCREGAHFPLARVSGCG